MNSALEDEHIEACLRTLHQAPRPPGAPPTPAPAPSTSTGISTRGAERDAGGGGAPEDHPPRPRIPPSAGEQAGPIAAVHRLRELVFQGRGRGSGGGAGGAPSTASSQGLGARGSTGEGLASFLRPKEQGAKGGDGGRGPEGEGEGQQRQRKEREREEERARQKGRARELERVHWALPALTRLQSRLTALHFVHSPSSATPGCALLLLSLVEFYCDAEEEGLPHLLPALTGYTTLLLPRHLHNEGVAEATLEFFLAHWQRVNALDASFLPDMSLLLLKAFACHVARLQPLFLRLLPRLLGPSSALQLAVAALDLPVLVMALENAEQEGLKAAPLGSRGGSPGVGADMGAGSGAGAGAGAVAGAGAGAGGARGGAQGASAGGDLVGKPDAGAQSESPTINAAEMMALMDASFTGTGAEGALYDSGDESVHSTGSGGGGGRRGGSGHGARPPGEALALLQGHMLLEPYNVHMLTSLWRTTGLLELLKARASTSQSPRLAQALACAPHLLHHTLRLVYQHMPQVVWQQALALLLDRFPLLLPHHGYTPQAQQVVTSALVESFSQRPPLLFSLQASIGNAICGPRTTRPQVELSLLLLWAVGEFIGAAGAAAEAARGGMLPPSSPFSQDSSPGEQGGGRGEGGGYTLGIPRGAELTAAQALLEAVELVLYESQARGSDGSLDSEELETQRAGEGEAAMLQGSIEAASGSASGAAGARLVPAWDGSLAISPGDRRALLQSLQLSASSAIARVMAARWELRPRARISLAKVARAQAPHPLVAMLAQDNAKLLQQAPQFFNTVHS